MAPAEHAAAVDEAPGAPSRLMVWAAFAAIYLIWGSIYLAIRYAVDTAPPFLMNGARFLIAGLVLYGWSILRAPSRVPAVQPRSGARAERHRSAADATAPRAHALLVWRDAFAVGALLIVGGTSLVAWAELTVPSGIASLVLATTPLWMVLLESMGAGGTAPAPRVLAGVVVGLVGLVILIGPSLAAPGQGVDLLGVGVLVLAALTWSAGSLYSRRARLPAAPARATGMQMLAGGLLSFAGGVALGEHRSFALDGLSTTSLLAFAYLIIAGAVIAFSAYLWLLRVSTPARVATHAYVNPVVAVLLGWAIAGEPVTLRTIVAMAVIVSAVVLIVAPRSDERAPPPARSARGRLRAIIPAWRER